MLWLVEPCICMHACMCICTMCMQVPTGQKMVSDSPEVELQVVRSHLVWVLASKLHSWKTASALNC